MTDRPWLTNYPKGVPANIDVDTYKTAVELLEECFDKYKKLPAFENMGVALTYEQIDKYSYQFGAYLHHRGLEPDDRIALMMPNLLQYPIALFGALRAGLIVVNTNPLYTPREMKHQFTDADVKAIVICDNFAANLEQILADTNIKTIITTPLGEMLGVIKGTMVNFVVKNIKRMVPKYNLPNTVSFGEALSQGKKFKIQPFETNSNDTILVQYTGGTTGVAKGAELTNRNLVSNMLQIKAYLFGFLQEGKEVALCPLPMYHIFAFTVHCLSLLAIGTKNVLVTNPRDLKSLIGEFNNPKSPITLMTGLNTLFNGLLNHKDFAKANFSKLNITVGGGMAMQRSVSERWEKVTGCPVSEGYGMTESSPVLSANPKDSNQLGTIGMPVPSTEMRIVDDNGAVLGVGEVGEIQARGPQVMKGYLNRPEATKEVIRDGWLCTGDIGMMQNDGFFRIVDRKKDMILVSGFNVYPNEIEEVLCSHPKISEAAAIGVPDEKSSEAVKVFIVKSDKSLTEKEVREFCIQNLTGYKKPKHIEFREDLPKTNVGKILRRMLKEESK